MKLNHIKMKNKILLNDIDLIETRVLSRFRSIFSIRDGIFSPLNRIKMDNPNAEIYLRHKDKVYEESISQIENLKEFNNQSEENFDFIELSDKINLLSLLNQIGSRIENDMTYLKLQLFNNKNYQVIGNRKDLYVHQRATINPGVIFDTRDGLIVIDENTEVSPFSYISGPIYVGKNCKLDNLKISGGCTIGNQVRIGGEIENSIISDFTNKHHEGFLGHSILGSWINIGALTTTSDLKNNYGQVKLKVPKTFIPSFDLHESDLEIIETGTNKFGSLIGDFVKIAIGTMLNTGTVLDSGSNIFGNDPKKYMPPFSWGIENNKYDINRFYNDCNVIFKRRNQIPNPEIKVIAERLTKNHT